jgi:hypothetical protein
MPARQTVQPHQPAMDGPSKGSRPTSAVPDHGCSYRPPAPWDLPAAAVLRPARDAGSLPSRRFDTLCLR